MLQASLWSLGQAVTKAPSVLVACDRGLGRDAVENALEWWRGPLEVWTAAELQLFSDRVLPPAISSLCRNHVFGLKIAALLHASAQNTTIYADTDVLWLRDPE